MTRALWHLCSFHEANLFPYQQWRVECAPDAADEASAEAEADGAAATVAWLERLAAAGGEAALGKLQPYELLGVGPFASADAAKAAARQLSRQFHPDKNLGESAARAAAIFVAVRGALASFLDGSWRQVRPHTTPSLRVAAVHTRRLLDGAVAGCRTARPTRRRSRRRSSVTTPWWSST